jgi:hypothetical protein
MITARKKSEITSLSFQSASATTMTAIATIVEMSARRAVSPRPTSDRSRVSGSVLAATLAETGPDDSSLGSPLVHGVLDGSLEPFVCGI